MRSASKRQQIILPPKRKFEVINGSGFGSLLSPGTQVSRKMIGTGPVDPRVVTVSGPVAGYTSWYDASDSLTYDGSNNISACADKGTNGFNATQGTGALQPLRVAAALNSLDVMRFSAGVKFLGFGATGIFSHTAAFTFEIIAKETAGGVYPGLFLVSGAARNLAIYRNDDPGDGTYHFSNPGIGLKITAPVQGTWFSIVIIFAGGTVTDPAQYTVIVNNVTVSTTSLAETPPTNRNQLSNQGGVGWVGDVANVQCWPFAFTGGNVTSQATYRFGKWAVA